MNKKSLSIDPRVSLFYVLLASLFLIFPFQLSVQYCFFGVVAGALLLIGKYRQVLCYLLIFVVFVLPIAIRHPILALIRDFLAIGFARMLPLFMTMSLAMDRQSTGKWQAAMAKMKMPSFLFIPLVVCIRFIPTFIQEGKQIAQSLKYRGLAQNWRQMLFHPWQFFEYFVIPLLSSSEQVIMDLSSSSLIRCIQNTNPKTSIYPIRLKMFDYLLFLIGLGMIGGQLWLHSLI